MSTPRYQRATGAASAVVDGETVVVSPADMRYHGLNATADAVWEELTEPRTLDELVEQLTERFEVDAATCRADVQACLDTMVEAGLVQLAN
jgi:hypothetical protein